VSLLVVWTKNCAISASTGLSQCRQIMIWHGHLCCRSKTGWRGQASVVLLERYSTQGPSTPAFSWLNCAQAKIPVPRKDPSRCAHVYDLRKTLCIKEYESPVMVVQVTGAGTIVTRTVCRKNTASARASCAGIRCGQRGSLFECNFSDCR